MQACMHSCTYNIELLYNIYIYTVYYIYTHTQIESYNKYRKFPKDITSSHPPAEGVLSPAWFRTLTSEESGCDPAELRETWRRTMKHGDI